ncbi:MAG TPA: hypothetical protein DEA90_14560, partial [Opitutae bacterium]|nr:hypothetical protein [Opitutae bacterium]
GSGFESPTAYHGNKARQFQLAGFFVPLLRDRDVRRAVEGEVSRKGSTHGKAGILRPNQDLTK